MSEDNFMRSAEKRYYFPLPISIIIDVLCVFDDGPNTHSIYELSKPYFAGYNISKIIFIVDGIS